MNELMASVRAVLATTPTRWLSLTESIPAELLGRRPAPGEWSALECLGHLVDTEEAAFPRRVEAFLAGRDFPGFDPDAAGSEPVGGEDPTELASRFALLRAASLEALEAIAPADLVRRARHAELGPVTLEEMLHEWAGHDLMHTVQAERAIMQPFIGGSGPWRGYFTDHDVDASRDAGTMR